MKRILPIIFVFTTVMTSYGQYEIYIVTEAINGIVTGLAQSKYEQTSIKKQRQADQDYRDLITQADLLYSQQHYQEAIALYNDALAIKDDQYPKDQIAKSTVEFAQLNREVYRSLLRQGDSLCTQLNYAEAIKRYDEAIKIGLEHYPKEQIAKANIEIARWKKVQFSGLLISDVRLDSICSKAYGNDPYSDFISPGVYDHMDAFLIYSNYQTLDGIAVPPKVRLIVYSEPNYKGNVLLDVTGPAIINNSVRQQDAQCRDLNSKIYGNSALQTIFPSATRRWSVSDMQTWTKGSMDIISQ